MSQKEEGEWSDVVHGREQLPSWRTLPIPSHGDEELEEEQKHRARDGQVTATRKRGKRVDHVSCLFAAEGKFSGS